jgi:hypothetical protein
MIEKIIALLLGELFKKKPWALSAIKRGDKKWTKIGTGSNNVSHIVNQFDPGLGYQIMFRQRLNNVVVAEMHDGNLRLSGNARLGTCPNYANNAAAVAGGLVSGDLYTVTGTNPLQVARVI